MTNPVHHDETPPGDDRLPSDADLLRRYVASRDEAAFGELAHRHVGLVYAAALRRLGGDAHSAADIAQQVFTALARRASTLADGAVLPGWLYATTRHLTADFVRAEQRRRAREQEASTMHELNSPPPSDAAWERLRPTLDQVIDELSEADRDAVLLRFFSRRPFAEIGATLRISEDAARMRVDRALEKLRGLLAKRDITSTSAALAAALANQAIATAPAGLATSVAGAALSGAVAVQVGTVGAVLTFMTATKTSLTLGVAATLAVATALYQTNEARAIAGEFASARRAEEEARARLIALEAKASAAEQALAQREKARPAASNNAGRSSANASAAEATDRQRLLQQYLDANPDLQRLERGWVRSWWRASQASYLRSLGFTPEQTERVIELTAQHKERQEALRKAGLPATSPMPSQAEYRAALGDAAADRLIAHDQFRWGPAQALSELASAIYFTDEPFTAQQTQQVLELLKEAKLTADAEGGAGSRWDWDEILRQAKPALSPGQLQGLQAKAALSRLDQHLAAAKKSTGTVKP